MKLIPHQFQIYFSWGSFFAQFQFCTPFISINYYAPNDENGEIQVPNEIQEQLDHLDPDQDTRIIWGGDFFVIDDTKLDADGGKPSSETQVSHKITQYGCRK